MSYRVYSPARHSVTSLNSLSHYQCEFQTDSHFQARNYSPAFPPVTANSLDLRQLCFCINTFPVATMTFCCSLLVTLCAIWELIERLLFLEIDWLWWAKEVLRGECDGGANIPDSSKKNWSWPPLSWTFATIHWQTCISAVCFSLHRRLHQLFRQKVPQNNIRLCSLNPTETAITW